jgi:hypothetical protein
MLKIITSKMNIKNLNIVLLISILFFSVGCKTHKSGLWDNYKASKKKGTEAILPDFSYAGYKYSEVPIPVINNYKIFNVIDFGAVPNDGKSDKNALLKAIEAAKKNKEGIVFFPKGTYNFFTEDDNLEPILIKTSNIIFRGEGHGEDGTILFFNRNLVPKDPTELWATPYMMQTASSGSNNEITTVTHDAKRETFKITVADASQIKKGDWVTLEVKNNDKDLIKYDLQSLKPEPEWTGILEGGVKVNERHQVASVKNNVITFVEPIHYDVKAKHHWSVLNYVHLEEVGFENLRFEGNWTEKFVHHKSHVHDGGWSILRINNCINSWIKDCTFKNVNRPLTFSKSAACTALNITITGNIGHTAADAEGSTGILMAKINDLAGMHHSVGVAGGSNVAAVIWRCKYPAYTSFEAHASQPRCTLFDNVEGGFFKGRAGGARRNLPNHGRYLVLWNYKETDTPEENFKFKATDSWWWQIVPPIIVGFHGAGTTFKEDEVQILESLGTPVKPESLFEEQLKLRLGGKLPDWINSVK